MYHRDGETIIVEKIEVNNLKYYDAFGHEVTKYVRDLEKMILDSKAEIAKIKTMMIDTIVDENHKLNKQNRRLEKIKKVIEKRLESLREENLMFQAKIKQMEKEYTEQVKNLSKEVSAIREFESKRTGVVMKI